MVFTAVCLVAAAGFVVAGRAASSAASGPDSAGDTEPTAPLYLPVPVLGAEPGSGAVPEPVQPGHIAVGAFGDTAGMQLAAAGRAAGKPADKLAGTVADMPVGMAAEVAHMAAAFGRS